MLVGNSSSGIIEASLFKKPVVNIGIRQRSRERGHNVIDVEHFNQKSIYHAIKKSLGLKREKLRDISIYGEGNISKKIVKQLERIKLNSKLIQKQITY